MQFICKTMATCDNDHWQSKILLAKLKRFMTDIEASYEVFRSCWFGQTHTRLLNAQMSPKREILEG